MSKWPAVVKRTRGLLRFVTWLLFTTQPSNATKMTHFIDCLLVKKPLGASQTFAILVVLLTSSISTCQTGTITANGKPGVGWVLT